MQAFNPSDHLDFLIPGNFRFIKEIENGLEFWIMLNDISAPGRTENISDLCLPCFLPSGFLISHNPEQVVDISVRFGHPQEGIFVNNYIWPQKIQQRIKIIVAVLQRCCRQKNNCVRVPAEQFHALIGPGIGVSDRMCLIDNDKVKMRRWVQICKSQ